MIELKIREVTPYYDVKLIVDSEVIDFGLLDKEELNNLHDDLINIELDLNMLCYGR